MGAKIKFQDVGKFERKLGQKTFRSEMRRALTRIGRNAVARLRTATMQAPPASDNGGRGAYASGAFYRAWSYRREGSRTVHVFNDAPHSQFVEGGRRPGRPPPVRVIAAWVTLKMGAQVAGAKDPERARDQLAYLIARKIGQRGLRGRHILDSNTSALRSSAMKTLLRALDDAIKKANK